MGSPKGRATADHVREGIAPYRRLKDSTVRTVLRRLEEKGYLTHKIDGRTYIYEAAIPPQSVATHAVRQIIDRLCGGSVERLLVAMVENDVLEPHELERLARKIALRKAGKGG
ncbi:MAG TPA: BlaI/MecI/CopY family transcriptional regulator [Bryobacteraceae bacterium]|nr:BlaI/MecI/CopY family transcriptional regulator [Bryobacteraceae bacterium]